MAGNSALVKELRQQTGAGILDCQKALQDTNDDMEHAIEYLRKKGLAAAEKKSGRATNQGVIGSYIHAGSKVGVLIEVNCETDFVAKNEEFQALVKDLTLQIAASKPTFVTREDVGDGLIEKEKSIYQGQARELGKPEAAWPKIIEGKLEKFYETNCLIEQPYIRDTTLTVQDLIAQKIAKIGENITVRRFTRYELGQV